MSITIAGNVGWAAVPNALGRSRLPHATLHLLLNLLTHSESFVATYRVIGEQTGMSSRTIATALSNLKKLGLVTVKKVPGENGRFDGNAYTFHSDRLFQITPELVDEKLRGATAVPPEPEGGDRCTNESGTAVVGKAAPLSEVKRIEEQEENHGRMTNRPPNPPAGGAAGGAAPSVTDRFAEWYAAYPRKKARGDALKAFRAASKKVPFEELMNGLERSKAQWEAEGRDATKLPYPATWLRAESWADEMDNWAASTPIERSNTLEDWLPQADTTPELPEAMYGSGPDTHGGTVIEHEEIPLWP